MLFTLAYRPFLDPLPLTGPAWWLLLIPLAVGIAVVYKAVRVYDMRHYTRNVFMLSAQIIFGMVGAVVGIHVLVEWIIPFYDTFLWPRMM